MSEYWIITDQHFRKFPTLGEAERERHLIQKRTGVAMRVIRCKKNLKAARNFPALVRALTRILRDGLTDETRAAAEQLLAEVSLRHDRSEDVKEVLS